ncbi:hypothetical protein HPG69_008842 [Diceros bicornis minor]|uniref:Uncharacterized protein n=1 Tax=Diceros bicornis minor TaxID=77932 RepID=A0A7J7FAW8_DICBM|nr:hypothetical protein HPG69_008842 [Diceros bicornis minor]
MLGVNLNAVQRVEYGMPVCSTYILSYFQAVIISCNMQYEQHTKLMPPNIASSPVSLAGSSVHLFISRKFSTFIVTAFLQHHKLISKQLNPFCCYLVPLSQFMTLIAAFTCGLCTL